MRLIARRVAAVVAIVLGLAFVSLAAFGTDATPLGRQSVPDEEPQAGTIPPLNPRAGNTDIRRTQVAPDIFGSEFGKRGKHVVTVAVQGSAYYLIAWRDKQVVGSRGPLTVTKTIEGGFPLVRIGIDAKGGPSTCVITVDGKEKDRQSTSEDFPIVFCEA
ncbi:MAG TPA: hypothetical protein VM093_06745 [Aeromicrobium sp.]|nr:hypothetical protein [Aeromicrobium sp.]